MIKTITKFCSILAFSYLSVSNTFADDVTTNSIISGELIFSNCLKVKQLLDDPKINSTPADKEALTKYLVRILNLQQTEHQFIKTTPNNYSPGIGALDVANYLDPERDKKAKLCSLEIIAKLLPQSAAILPDLINLAIDKRNSLELRDRALNQTYELTSLIQREGFPEYIIKSISDNLKNNDNVLRSKVSINLIIALLINNSLNIEELLKTQDPQLRDNLLNAVTILYYSDNSKFDYIKEILNNSDDGTKAQFITKLKFFAKFTPKLIELVPPLLKSSSELVKSESLKLLKYLNQHSAFYASFYITNSFPDEILQQYLELNKISDEALSKDLIKTLITIELKEKSTFCNVENTTDKVNIEEYSNDSANYFLRKTICPLKHSDKEKIIDGIKKNSLESILPLLLSLNIRGNIDEDILSGLLSSSKIIQKKYSSREYSNFIYLTLHAALKHNSVKLKNNLITLAIEGLGFDFHPSTLVDTFFYSKNNPAVEYLSNNFQLAEPKLIKVLSEKSPLLIRNTLTIISKNEPNRTLQKQTLVSLIKLLGDDNIEVRRSAYLILKSRTNQIAKLIGNLTNYNSNARFYLSRIILDNKEQFSPTEIKSAITHFTPSIKNLECRERTVQFPELQLEVTSNEFKSLFNSEIQCLKDSAPARARIIKNISAFSNIPEDILITFATEYANVIKAQNDGATLGLAYDLLRDKNSNNKLVIQLLSNGLNSEIDENLISTLNWLESNRQFINSLKDQIKETIDEDNPKISIQGISLYYKDDFNKEAISKIRQRFFKGIEQSDFIFSINLNNHEWSQLSLNNANDNQSYFGNFLNTIFCGSKIDAKACEQIFISPSLVIDKPYFFKNMLSYLLNNDPMTNPSQRQTIKNLSHMMILNGLTEELSTLKKNQEMINILNELRVETSNKANAKTLDYTIEY